MNVIEIIENVPQLPGMTGTGAGIGTQFKFDVDHDLPCKH